MTLKSFFLLLSFLVFLGAFPDRGGAENKNSPNPKPPPPQKEVVLELNSPSPAKKKDEERGQKEPSSFNELFSNEISLAVPLPDVVILVIVINIFALFNKARWILVASYLAACKWVLYSNYSEIVRQSGAISQASVWVFVTCGVLTLVFWWTNRFEKSG